MSFGGARILAYWFRILVPQLTDTVLVVRSRRSGKIHQCAAGGMNAQGMKEHGGVATCDGGGYLLDSSCHPA